MKIHYFQRYHQKENVSTANTLLLLSRLYQYSADKFFQFLKSAFFYDSFEPEIAFNLQEKGVDSILDATITQESFRIVVETKLTDWFYSDQLERHLKTFKDERYKVIITLAPELMDADKKAAFDERLNTFNQTQSPPILHINTTFERIAMAIQEVIDERDYEMQEVLDDFINYCMNDNLICVPDAWKYMRVKRAGATFDENVQESMYYDDIEHGFRPHDYIGLYADKSVRAIGKICAIITAVYTDGEPDYHVERGSLSDAIKDAINRARQNGRKYGYELNNTRFFFVERFYPTDFRKITPRALMGTRIFDLSKLLGTESLPNTERIAEDLQNMTWE